MAKDELAQERAQPRGCIGAVKQRRHRPVPYPVQIRGGVGAGDQPGDQRADLAARVRALVGRYAQVLIGELETKSVVTAL